jgi:hypothetical protein
MWRMRHVPKVKWCCVCYQRPRVSFGRCPECERGMVSVYRDYLQGLSRAERDAEYDTTENHHPRPKWTYENEAGERELIAEAEKQDEVMESGAQQ